MRYKKSSLCREDIGGSLSLGEGRGGSPPFLTLHHNRLKGRTLRAVMNSFFYCTKSVNEGWFSLENLQKSFGHVLYYDTLTVLCVFC